MAKNRWYNGWEEHCFRYEITEPDPDILLNPDPDPGCCRIRIQLGSESNQRFYMKEIFFYQKMPYMSFKHFYIWHKGSREASSPEKNSYKKFLLWEQLWPAWIRIHTNSFESGPETHWRGVSVPQSWRWREHGCRPWGPSTCWSAVPAPHPGSSSSRSPGSQQLSLESTTASIFDSSEKTL
jgi:hypothetical protein